MVISDIINFIMGMFVFLLIVAAVGYPGAKLIDWFQQKRIIKKIPEKVKKEVQDARERKDKKQRKFQDFYAEAEARIEESGREPIEVGGGREEHVIRPDAVEPDEGSTIKRTRVQVPTPDTVSKNRKRIELHKPATLRLEQD